MAKKKTDEPKVYKEHPSVDQRITDTLRENYMPYAMSVIVSRAIPEIDGFKPSHRKLLYTMYKMGLLNGNRTKSANIVGQTMKLNPHGDAAIYETMVRLTRGNEALLMPFVDSKGNFGKVYSRDMAYAAPRYTEAKLDAFCAELFRDIDTDAVDFVDNYDGEMKEPTLLPTTYPNILVSANTGIAVGMASNFCGFNLAEVCRTTIELIKNPEHDILSTLPAPDFTTGGELIYDEAEMRAIYRTGRGSFKVRAKWAYNKKDNLIEITEIPYTTTIEAIIDKIAELVKNGKVREIADVRDETDLSGLKIAIDLKRGTDPEKLMAKLMKMTTLQDSFSCNFNVLIAGMPRVLGVAELLDEWTAWRTECVRRRVFFDLNKKKDKLHLLLGLRKILLDIDKAIKIIRETEEDANVIPNLMEGFGIDKIQAEFIADIRLRNINKEYILKRTQETEAPKTRLKSWRKSSNPRRRSAISSSRSWSRSSRSTRPSAARASSLRTTCSSSTRRITSRIIRCCCSSPARATSRRLRRSRGACRRTISSKRAMRCSGRLRRPTRTKLSFSPICSRRTRRTCTILRTARRLCSVITLRPSWRWTRAKRRFMPSCRVTTRAVWSLCSKTARQPGFRWNPSRPRPTDAA